MWERQQWIDMIERAWEQRSVIWLSGVRRAGKTVLCRTLENVEYFDCELPSVRRRLEDPESFLAALDGRRVVLDEIQRLSNPSEILKIAADHYPQTSVVATGSSTLQASSKFRDTLTGRKTDLWLTPMTWADLVDFEQVDLPRRMLRGGLPPMFLANESPSREFEEWLDSFWARDIQELFRLERQWSFRRFLELLLTQSGGMFEATRFTAPCEISRTTVANYLSVLEGTRAAHVVRPFSTHRATEIVAAPKVYGFDTGFVCHFRGWTELRSEDMGSLWEHLVLNQLHAQTQRQSVCYWRDKRGHEVDFVLPAASGSATAIECKWSTQGFDPQNLRSFRLRHPDGENWLVAADVAEPYTRHYEGIPVRVMRLQDIASIQTGASKR
jgi:uncharacterized protein